METSADYQKLRGDTGHSDVTLPDYEASVIYAEATSLYSASAIRPGTRVLTLLQLLGSATKLHDYVQNNSSENASQVFSNLQKLLTFWQAALDKALADDAATSTATSAQSMRVPVVSAW